MYINIYKTLKLTDMCMNFHCIRANVDGHECVDVVAYRKEYLKMANSLPSSYLPLPPCSDVRACTPPENAETKLMMMFHDESIFSINEGQGWIWGTGDKPFIQLTKVAGIMVSDFITQQDGYPTLSSEECELPTHVVQTSRVLLEYRNDKEGYWTGEKDYCQCVGCGCNWQLQIS